jgi:threo-3-hydroxy-L-aspartate ammonia-lyase
MTTANTQPTELTGRGTPTYDDILRAAECIKGVARITPTMTSRSVDDQTGGHIFFKCENFQRTGAFKFRGAYNALSALAAEQRGLGVLAYSSGNHAQAIALAGRLLEIRTTILMPADAPATKVSATRAYGGEVLFYDRYREDREAIGQELAEDRGLTLIPSYDHHDVVAGQGTSAKELFEEIGALDALLVPLGGGGLLAGSALAAAMLCPSCQVIGVEPEVANDGQMSFRRGEIVHIPAPRSIADGAIVTHLGNVGFPIIRSRVTDVLTVSDAALVTTMRAFAERLKIIVEPTGCLAAAAVLEGSYPCLGKRVGVLVSGGNVDLQAFAELVVN